jgi:hypothetical protein
MWAPPLGMPIAPSTGGVGWLRAQLSTASRSSATLSHGPAIGPGMALGGFPVKIRMPLAAAGATALLGAGALVLPAAASARSDTHTLKFISLTSKAIMFTQTTGAEQNTNVNTAGKIVGFNTLYFTVNPSTGKITANATINTKGGFLYGIVTTSTTSRVSHGKVTGGTGAFEDATGTIVGRDLNKTGTRSVITITYST